MNYGKVRLGRISVFWHRNQIIAFVKLFQRAMNLFVFMIRFTKFSVTR
jgi:hypothetical protein